MQTTPGSDIRDPSAAASRSDNPAHSPEQVVRAFLALMEARDLKAAELHLAPGFVMNFPGRSGMTRLDELASWARDRYRTVRKTFLAFETCAYEDHAIVFCHGHLSGEWPDGASFDGVRFIDRFEVHGALLVRQDVWNDLALARS